MLRWLRRWRSGTQPRRSVELVQPPPDVDPLDESRQILRDFDDSAPVSWTTGRAFRLAEKCRGGSVNGHADRVGAERSLVGAVRARETSMSVTVLGRLAKAIKVDAAELIKNPRDGQSNHKSDGAATTAVARHGAANTSRYDARKTRRHRLGKSPRGEGVVLVADAVLKNQSAEAKVFG